jgi:hypothetical protein
MVHYSIYGNNNCRSNNIIKNSDCKHGLSVHVNDVNHVRQANTSKKSLVSYFRGTVALRTLEHSRTDQVKCIVS